MLDDRIALIARAKVRSSLFGCQSWLIYEQFMGSCYRIRENMSVDLVLISDPENMPELHVVNCGHSAHARIIGDCVAWTLAWRYIVIHRHGAWLRLMNKRMVQNYPGAWSCLIWRGFCSSSARQISSYLSLKIWLPWKSNDISWTVVTRTTQFNGFSATFRCLDRVPT